MEKSIYSKIIEGAAGRGRGLLIYNLDLRGDYFPGFTLVKRFVMQRTSTLSETVYLFQPIGETGKDVILRVSVAELNNAQNAKARLEQELMQSMRPEIPQGTGDMEALGDVNFVARAAPADFMAGISFARGNICVTVRNAGAKAVDVSELAKQVDALLSGEPAVDAAEAVGLRASSVERSERAGRTERRTIAAEGKERVTVVPALGEVTKGWVRISVPHGELSREGNEVVYRAERSGGGDIDLQMSVFEGPVEQ